MAMPEASVDEDDRMVFWKNQIRPAGQCAIIKAITETACVKTFPDDQFRLCVFAAYRSHVAAARFSVMDVSQLLPVPVYLPASQ
ncbi:hypothetical protein EDC90_10512 [Martelella mediterranea]|uniref:Uncharacterized protein n=1 Tax=Martelella mediterranea TaxID=293089 RepID=A0A4R3NJQ9_9HYPH|nr:hypothetical protein EDC90_10512 [Martelella mediterranea]